VTYGPQTPFLDPDNFLFGMHYPGEAKNQSHVDDLRGVAPSRWKAHGCRALCICGRSDRGPGSAAL